MIGGAPLYLATDPEPTFAMFHAAADGPGVLADAGASVVIVPPWGWHEVASHRSRRDWADHLAARGHPTLRIDLPGTGDSGGSSDGPCPVEAWVAAIGAAAAWLRATEPDRPVCVIGLGLGGLLAARAAAEGALIAELVAWSVPDTGRAEMRRQRAFARLQPDRFSLTEPEPTVLPEGWLEVNGFVLSAAAIAGIEGLTFPGPSLGSIRRVLLLDSDGIAVAAGVREGLGVLGADVTSEPGPGWQAMTFHPQQHEPPLAVFATTDAWLDAAPAVAVPKAPLHRTALPDGRHGLPTVDRPDGTDQAATTVLSVDGVAIRETALSIDAGGGRRLFAILTGPEEPHGRTASPLAALFLNAGAVRRIGPNRIWVDVARRWAGQGVASLRIDLDGIGDSDGDAGRYRDVGQFYDRDDLADQINRFSAELVRRTGATGLLVGGLCAGGYWAFHAAAADDRVRAACLINPGALEWRTDLVRGRNVRRIMRMSDPAWWARLARGQVRADRVRAILSSMAGEAAARAARVGGRSGVGDRPGGGGRSGVGDRPGAGPGAADPTSAVRRPPRSATPGAILDALRDRGTTVTLAFSSDEALHDELSRSGLLDRLPAWPNVRLEALPGRDHTLRPIVAQRAVHDLLDRTLSAELARMPLAAQPRAG